MVLAAGRGERMRPLSDVLPKPALPLPGGSPVVASAMRQAVAGGAHRLVVNAWHLPELLEEAVQSVDVPDAEVRLSVEAQLMGTAGGIALARVRGLLPDDGAPLLVLNGDSLMELDLEPLLHRHRTAGDLVTLALLPHPAPSRWASVHLARDGRVREIRRATDPDDAGGGLLYPGVMVVAGELVVRLEATPGDAPGHIWRPAREAGRLGGATVAGSWREVGSPAAYLEAVQTLLRDVEEVHPTASVDGSATVRGSMIGRRARLMAGCEVVGSVVAAGARVEVGATVDSSVVLGDVTVPAGVALHGGFLARRG